MSDKQDGTNLLKPEHKKFMDRAFGSGQYQVLRVVSQYVNGHRRTAILFVAAPLGFTAVMFLAGWSPLPALSAPFHL